MARLAYAMAMETDHVKAEVVEVQEFPHLAQAFRISSVPKTVINGMAEMRGAVPEQVFFYKFLTAIGRSDLLEVARIPESQEPFSAPSTALWAAQQQGYAGQQSVRQPGRLV